MKRHYPNSIRCFGTVMIVLIFAGPTAAQQAPVFVGETTANDSNPCTRAQPCRQLTRALQVVPSGGEIIVLESAIYDPIIINKSVTITGEDGKVAVIYPAAASGAAITIGAGLFTITLRGLTLKGPNGGLPNGIDALKATALQLSVHSCVINKFGVGILYGGTGRLSVRDTLIQNCTTSAVQAIGGQAWFEHCVLDNNQNGLWVGLKAQAAIRSSVASGSKAVGLRSEQSGRLTVEACLIVHNQIGIQSDPILPNTGLPSVWVANSTIAHNATGLRASGGGKLLSRQPASNTLIANIADGIFTSTFNAR